MSSAALKKASSLSGDERQTEESRKGGNIWSAIRTGSLEEVQSLLAVDPSVIFQRGPVGELALHLCFLYNTPVHKTIARFMMDRHPHITCQTYAGFEYSGENILHIAVINRDLESVKELVRRQPLLLTGKATGKFFSRGSACYYGESPLAFAVCTNQKRMFIWLLDNGGVHQLTQVDKYVKAKCAELMIGDLWSQPNFDGFTPFTLAAETGNAKMFDFLLDERKQTQWKYGPVSCELIPLKDLDTSLGDSGSDNSALELILQHGHVDLLMHPRIISLLSFKWSRFAQHIFWKRALVFTLYLILFSITTVFRIGGSPYVGTRILLILDLLLISGAVWKARKELFEMQTSGLIAYLSSQGSAFIENIVSVSFCTTILCSYPLIYLGSPSAFPLLALASLLGWSYLFFFLLAFRLTGPIVIMVYTMLRKDVFRFLCIFLVFLMAFAQSFYILFDENGFGGFMKALQICFLTMIGEIEWEPFKNNVEIFLLVVYIVLITILLLNLLIAMFGDTIESINEAAEKEWHLERARIMLSIESEMTLEERLEKQNIYWVEVNGDRFIQVQEVDPKHWKSDEEIEKEKAAKEADKRMEEEKTAEEESAAVFEIPVVTPSRRRMSVMESSASVIQAAARRGSMAAERRFSMSLSPAALQQFHHGQEEKSGEEEGQEAFTINAPNPISSRRRGSLIFQ